MSDLKYDVLSFTDDSDPEAKYEHTVSFWSGYPLAYFVAVKVSRECKSNGESVSHSWVLLDTDELVALRDYLDAHINETGGAK